jgi:two-component system phosphate regulon sensor histidine kinase PhoR
MKFKSHHKVTLTFGFLVAVVLFSLYFYLDKNLQFSQVPANSVHLEKFFWFAILACVILVCVLNFLVSMMITKPIERISNIAQAIAQGDFSKKAFLAQGGEIDDLAKAVDFMSQEISARMKQASAGKSRLEAVFLSMIEGVMVVNQDGKILLINETLKKILHVERQVQGRKPLEVIRNIEVQEIVDRVLVLSKGVQDLEMSFFLPEEKILRIHAAPVLLDGQIDGAVLVFHDITDFRRLETIRKDFVTNVSHEFRTPVANIKGYSETLLEGALNDKEHAVDFLKIIYSESGRLAQLVDDLLELARHESGRPRLDFQPCCIGKILDGVLVGLRIQAKQYDVRVISEISQDIALVKVDEFAVAQLLFNLLENAIKYNQKGGQVIISATNQDAHIEVVVSDNGLGIPADDLPRIFERFYRVDKAHSREIGGTGLGLSIVKHIIQSHGGKIIVESQLGQGSTFRFTLPKA